MGDFRPGGDRRPPLSRLFGEAAPSSRTSSLHLTCRGARHLSPAHPSLSPRAGWGRRPGADASVMRHEAAGGRSLQGQGLVGVSFATPQGPLHLWVHAVFIVGAHISPLWSSHHTDNGKHDPRKKRLSR